jgi:hypothetical protein
MVKHFCDRCDEEIPEHDGLGNDMTGARHIHQTRINGNSVAPPTLLCVKCWRTIREILMGNKATRL